MARFILFLSALLISASFAQQLPSRYHYSDDDNRLTMNISDKKGIYNDTHIDTVFLQFSQTNYATLLTNNYASKTNIAATLTYKGKTYQNVGVRYKGMTSYSGFGATVKKKSYDLEMDWMVDKQDLNGYANLNFNNWYQDKSAMREVLYYNLAGNHIPNARAGFVLLYINGVNQGIYHNVQSLDKKHAGECFFDDKCTRWRAEATTTTGVGGGFAGFGAGKSSLNNLGIDTAEYKKNYTLKKSYKPYPWEDLKLACQILSNVRSTTDSYTDDQMVDSLSKYFDIDGALWMVASEIVYVDDDGYVNKGGMDYYVYFDTFTGRIVPIEYDGNTCLDNQYVTTWGVFHKESNTQFPLMNILFKVPQLRQRYLAHMRTILAENFDSGYAVATINRYAQMINQYLGNSVDNATKNEVLAGIEELKNFFPNRANFLKSNSELNVQGLTISNVQYSVNGVPFSRPSAQESVRVSAQISGNTGVSAVYLYYGTTLAGRFKKIAMTASGGTYSATIPAQPKGTNVRYYIEATANNNAKTATYSPAGAEHDVYIYQVRFAQQVSSHVVINEIMADNKSTVANQDGVYADWIELYNNSDSPINLSGYSLTDREATLAEWRFPNNTTIQGKDYLIIWADDKNVAENGSIHTNFKLSSDGETVYLVTPAGDIADTYIFGKNTSDIAFARVPNGIGAPIWQEATFAAHNEGMLVGVEKTASKNFTVYPNPSNSSIYFDFLDEQEHPVSIVSATGELLFDSKLSSGNTVEVAQWPAGLYLLRIEEQLVKLVIY